MNWLAVRPPVGAITPLVDREIETPIHSCRGSAPSLAADGLWCRLHHAPSRMHWQKPWRARRIPELAIVGTLRTSVSSVCSRMWSHTLTSGS